jgi:tight adherence protein B
LLASVALVLLLVFAPRAAAAGITLSEGGGSTYPARSLVLAVPGRTTLSPANVRISENGQRVNGAVVRPIAKAYAGDFGVVLAIDVSPSMKGAPLERAMAAARALAAQRTGQQELGVVTFDRTANVALPLTDEPQAIARALAQTPKVGHGAYIYNASNVAVQQLARAHIAAGAVILLSDGASIGARPKPGHNLTASSVGAAASAAGVQIYTVGLRDSSYTPQRMRLLAGVGGGAFIESSSSQLASAFRKIEAGLTAAYVVRYRSQQEGGRHVLVSVTVDGVTGGATLAYTSPSPPTALTVPRVPHDNFWTSTAALLVFGIGAAILIGLATVAFLAPRIRRDSLRRRVGAFITPTLPERRDDEVDGGARRLAALEHMLERTRWWGRFKSDVEIAGFERSAIELVAICVLATLAVAVFVAVGLHVAVLAVAALGIGPLALNTIVRRRLHKRREEFASQLPNHLQELASTMRAGHSLVSGLTAMTGSASEPSHSEWGRVISDEQVGMPLEAALRPLAERMDCRDIEQVALVASLQQRSGGNMAEVLERLADGIRERADLRRELNALTAQARLSRWVVTGLPIGLLLVLSVINPNYVKPLFHTTGGQVMLGLAVVMITSGSLVMRRITDIDA